MICPCCLEEWTNLEPSGACYRCDTEKALGIHFCPERPLEKIESAEVVESGTFYETDKIEEEQEQLQG